MAIHYYPIAIKLKGKTTLVAGGGKVCERKVESLLKSGAAVRIVSPSLTARLKRLVTSGKISWRNKEIERSDLKDAEVIIAATSSEAVNEKVSGWARQQGALVNVVDQPSLSDFISPAVLRRGKAIVTVYTNGKDPVLSRDIKNFLKERWDEFISYRNRLQKRVH